MPEVYPIDAVLPALLQSLATKPRLVLEAPPGAGKTTQVAPAMLNASWCTGRIVMLEPRRIAARAAANFMAGARGESVGATVGYRIRFESRVSAATRIELVTEGILTRMLQDDPGLNGISAVIFDEFHERHLAGDLGLALCLDVQSGLRPDLRLLVMSATLDGERVASFLDAPRLSASGRSFPVRLERVALRPRESAVMQLRRAARLALDDNEGDVLCFLPGRAEIARAAVKLDDLGAALETLHGEMDVTKQASLLEPGSRRRLILATNVAESSITLPGVGAVIDSGLAREPRFDPASGLSRLVTVPITKASATQRAGRAGRTAPGVCYRLWPESQRLETATRPELLHVELSAFVLEMKLWGAESLAFLDPPPPGAVAHAHDVLQKLGALDSAGRLTAHGRAIAPLGVHPRLASSMLGAPQRLTALACDVSALLEGREVLRGEAARSDDLWRRYTTIAELRAGRCDERHVNRSAASAVLRAANSWRKRLRVGARSDANIDPGDIGHIVALAYPERIARRNEVNPSRYLMANGRGAHLSDDSNSSGEPWLAVANVRLQARDSLIQLAAPLDPGVLETAFGAHFNRERACTFDGKAGAVETRERLCFGSIVVEEKLLPTVRDAASSDMLIAGVARLGVASLPWTPALREWQARVQCLRAWCPELDLPDISDEALGASLTEWLRPFVAGFLRTSDITPAVLSSALKQRLDHAQRATLDELAPLDLLLPSGRRRSLNYAAGESPVLAVKLQELFGLSETPRIAGSRVIVTLHLLSPRGIPIQVTQDLAGFWQRTYADVRKELKGRYPKHPWPDDPLSAQATSHTKRAAKPKR